jgi:hypothetical protein
VAPSTTASCKRSSKRALPWAKGSPSHASKQGWWSGAKPLPQCNILREFTDVRDLLSQMKQAGIEPVTVEDGEGKGPGSFVIVDPDGNPVLIDQHV